MRGESHRCLGKYLSQRYMTDVSKWNTAAFLIGCIEPDRNPVTYLKGSFRFQWLRGHNYRNALRYMRRISRRLEEKDRWNIWDYYTLGKLIHYTADAFTYAHNDSFPSALADHRAYEITLQNHFLEYIRQDPSINVTTAKSVMDVIVQYHREYEEKTGNIRRDSHFALAAACCVLALLFPKAI